MPGRGNAAPAKDVPNDQKALEEGGGPLYTAAPRQPPNKAKSGSTK